MNAATGITFFMGPMYLNKHEVPAGLPPCVYVLVDPRQPNAPRYVGSSRDLIGRVKSHQSRWPCRNDEFDRWWKQLDADGVRPALRVVAVFDTIEEARRAEWRVQQRWANKGLPLVSRVWPAADEGHLSWMWARARMNRHLQRVAA
jgi:predicted GIY-YIG superfamily endonuclease